MDKEIALGNKVLSIADIDCVIKKNDAEGSGILVHTSNSGSVVCLFHTEIDRDEGWEDIDKLLMGEGYIHCDGMFFRREAIGVVVTGQSRESGAYVQITLRGGLVIRRPCNSPESAEHYRQELSSFLGNQPCRPQ